MQYGRRAYGPQRPMTPAQQAANVAVSLLEHPERTIDDYNVIDETLRQLVEQTLQQMIEQALARITTQRAA